jgi:hypothetical protein
MKTLLAAATIIAGLALAPAALAGNSTGHTAQSDTSTALPNPYQNTGSASAALQGYTTRGLDSDCRAEQASTSKTVPNPYANTGSASAALQGYTTRGATRSATVTLLATAGSSGSTFDWGDAGIGAAGAIGAVLILIGLSLVALRRRGRLAV